MFAGTGPGFGFDSEAILYLQLCGISNSQVKSAQTF